MQAILLDFKACIQAHNRARLQGMVLSKILTVKKAMLQLPAGDKQRRRRRHSGCGGSHHPDQHTDVPEPLYRDRRAGAAAGGDRLPRIPAHVAHQVHADPRSGGRQRRCDILESYSWLPQEVSRCH